MVFLIHTLSNVSVYKWCSTFEEGSETVENEPHWHRPRTSVIGENSDGVDVFIWEKGRMSVHESSGTLIISDGSLTTIVKQHLP